MPRCLLACMTSLLAASAAAADMRVRIELPRLEVAEYHRPYVAVWIEREDRSVAADLSVWYQQDRAPLRPRKRAPGEPGDTSAAPGSAGGGESGTKWLPDLRQWWRRSGRHMELPVDGVTGATRPVGLHALTFESARAPLDSLAPGSYRLVVEAVREVGGRELLRLPFSWPPIDTLRSEAEGETELGRVELQLSP